MQLNDFSFELPNELIARYPLAKRSASRLLCLQDHGSLIHRHFYDVIDLIQPHDLLVFNDTKVIPARLFGHRLTGGRVEIMVEKVLDDQRMLAQVRASKTPRVGEFILLPQAVRFEVLAKHQQFYELRYEKADRPVISVIEAMGEIPLPPYMQRSPDANDIERYQTVYAKHKGSVAAPTAGLHFDDDLMRALQDKGVQMGHLTLHIGAGTFAPVRVENIHEHVMHAEYLDISADLCAQIRETKQRGHRVIAVGTTSLRALETASESGTTQPYHGETNIFIYPGYQFHSADALITNLHLPRSTLLMLVCAFGGYQPVMDAYREAVANAYRFYSYGDAMWVARAFA